MLFGVQERAIPRTSPESVAGLEQQHLAPVVMRVARRRNAGETAADHDHVV
jgi:hypothetical protein